MAASLAISLAGTGRLTDAPLDTDLVELVAERLRLLGSPVRIRILMLLEQQPLTVGELADGLNMLHALVSHHLKDLRNGGVVKGEAEGKHVRYAIVDYSACMLLRSATAGAGGRSSMVNDVLNPTG